MENKYGIISATVAFSLLLSACGPKDPSVAHAASLEPAKNLPQPGVDTKVMNKIDLPAPYATPEEIQVATIPATEIKPFLYFSQTTFGEEATDDQSKLSDVGCGIDVGAMVTRTDPFTYLKDFYRYFDSIGKYGPAQITKNGSDIKDHMATLEMLGFRVDELSVQGSTMEEVKAKIKELTAQGIPVWVNAGFFGKGHHSMAIGIAPDGNIIFNDSLYGQGKEIPDRKIRVMDDKGNIVWKVYAVYPPQISFRP